MDIKIIALTVSLGSLALSVLAYLFGKKVEKMAEAALKQAEAELEVALKEQHEAEQRLKAQKKEYAEFTQFMDQCQKDGHTKTECQLMWRVTAYGG